MPAWSNSALELTLLFPVDKKYWLSLTKVEQQQLVKEHTEADAATRGEVVGFKGFKTVDPATVDEWMAEKLATTDVVVVHAEVWVIPNKEERAKIDGT